MKIRRFVSLTALLSFIILTLTAFILYLEPHGRVAYWVDWRLWGLTKSQWDAVHINMGVLFLVAVCLHIYFNWKAVTSYLKDRTHKLKVFTVNFNLALVVIVLFLALVFTNSPPCSWILEWNEQIKEAAAEKYGKPPYGHAELSSLKTLTSRVNLPLGMAIERLKAAHIRFESEEQPLEEIARMNRITPKQLYEIMKPVRNKSD